MELAFVTGFDPSLLTDIEGHGPLVHPQDAVAFAYRDRRDQEDACRIAPSEKRGGKKASAYGVPTAIGAKWQDPPIYPCGN